MVVFPAVQGLAHETAAIAAATSGRAGEHSAAPKPGRNCQSFL